MTERYTVSVDYDDNSNTAELYGRFDGDVPVVGLYVPLPSNQALVLFDDAGNEEEEFNFYSTEMTLDQAKHFHSVLGEIIGTMSVPLGEVSR